MDVTPNPGMLKAMQSFADATVGEAPRALDTGPGAMKRRAQRRMVMDFLHNLVRLSMREGVARHYIERGWPVAPDDIRPNPLGNAVRESMPTSDNIIMPGS